MASPHRGKPAAQGPAGLVFDEGPGPFHEVQRTINEEPEPFHEVQRTINEWPGWRTVCPGWWAAVSLGLVGNYFPGRGGQRPAAACIRR